MKVLYFDWHSQASEFYRLLPLDYLKDFFVTRSSEREIHFSVISQYDVIIFLRPTSQFHLSAIQQCKDQHKKVILDYDDDVLRVPRTNPMYETYQQDKNTAIECLTLADEIWVTTDSIKQSFRFYNNNIHIIPNALNDYIFNKKKPFVFNKHAMYRGGHSHKADIYEVGTTEYIIDFINSNPLWKFFWLGQWFDFFDFRLTEGNVYRNEGASTIQFYKMMQEMQPCLFFYPLQTHVFNQGKSACSFLEAVYAGAAYFGNTSLPEFQKPGILPFASVAEVMKMPDKKLERLLKKNHDLSWQFIQKNLLLSKVNLLREKRLHAICK